MTYDEAKDFVCAHFILIKYYVNGVESPLGFVGPVNEWNVDQDGLAVSHQTVDNEVCVVCVFAAAGHITYHHVRSYSYD